MTQKEFINQKLEEFDNDFSAIERFGNGGLIYGKNGTIRFDEYGSQLGAIRNFIVKILADQAKILEESLPEPRTMNTDNPQYVLGFNACRQIVIDRFKEYQDK